MVLVLVIGDLHIPHRTHDLPQKFKKLLLPGKIQQILCTGNVCDRETLEYLRTISPDVYLVSGDYDDPALSPSSSHAGQGYVSHTLTHTPIRIGLLHGHQAVPPASLPALSALARQMDVDVLVSGHTHLVQAVAYEGRFFLNPGSATGAWAPGVQGETTPAFALMDIQGPVVVTYVYQLVEGEVRVEKVEWRKEDPVPVNVNVQVAPQAPSSPVQQAVW